jgi:hypothetical protein
MRLFRRPAKADKMLTLNPKFPIIAARNCLLNASELAAL